MDFKRKVNKTATPAKSAVAPAVKPVRSQSNEETSRALPVWMKYCLAVVGLIVVSGLVYWAWPSPQVVDKDHYQAVFLDNGQVYVGKLHNFGTETPHMSQVYYLQGTNTEEDDELSNAQTLLRIEEAVHKPQDRLILNANKILFVQNLSYNSPFVDIIEKN